MEQESMKGVFKDGPYDTAGEVAYEKTGESGDCWLRELRTDGQRFEEVRGGDGAVRMEKKGW
jgi:hypothetical protein